MSEHLPLWISVVFVLVLIFELGWFYKVHGRNWKIILFLSVWTVLHSALAYVGFYEDTSMPPRFALMFVPFILITIYAMLPRQLDAAIAVRDLKLSAFLHTIRIPIELMLFQLFVHGLIPELMTFEGRNFDILAGITAPIVGALYYYDKISDQALRLWNCIALGLVLFILINALLSAELPFQQFAFDQPNKAVMQFPAVLLPAIIVPLVIYNHLVDIVALTRRIRSKK